MTPPTPGRPVPLGIGCVSLGSINFNFIWGPIPDAIKGVGAAISSAVNAATTALNNTINSVQSALQAGIDAVTNTVDTGSRVS